MLTAEFGRHARVRDAVRAGHVGELELAGDRVGAADLLVELHARAGADEPRAVLERGDEVAGALLLSLGAR